MHVRFTVPWQTNIAGVECLIKQIGNPKLLFHDYYFCGDVDPTYLDKLYDLQFLGKIVQLGFLQYHDDPVPGDVSNGG